MQKILIVSTVSRQFWLFERTNIAVLSELGYQVHCAANYGDRHAELDGLPVVHHEICIERSPLRWANIRAIRDLVRLIKKERFDAVHCHSPVGGLVGRIAAKFAKVGCVIYTAHGFHFFKGAKLKNWLLYFPVEWCCSFATDLLVTINQEDYRLARRLHARKVVQVPGIGVDTARFVIDGQLRRDVRQELGLSNEQLVMLSIGELFYRKNHETALKALSLMRSDAMLLICGRGEGEAALKQLAVDLQIENRVVFLGFRRDIPALCAAADCYVTCSFQEGLPVATIEAMSAGLPIVASRVRGNVDLVRDGINGFLCSADQPKEFAQALDRLLSCQDRVKNFGAESQRLAHDYDRQQVATCMRTIYTEALTSNR